MKDTVQMNPAGAYGAYSIIQIPLEQEYFIWLIPAFRN